MDQVILLAGSPLDDDAVIGQCGINEHTTLEVVARLLGGMYFTDLNFVIAFIVLHVIIM